MNDFEFTPITIQTLKVGSMTCGHCKVRVEKILNELTEVESVEVDLIDGTVEVIFSTDISNDKLKDVLGNAGYPLISTI